MEKPGSSNGITEQQALDPGRRQSAVGGQTGALLAIIFIQRLSRAGAPSLGAGAICLATVIYAAYSGRLLQGFAAAIVWILYLLTALSPSGAFLHFGSAEALQLCARFPLSSQPNTRHVLLLASAASRLALLRRHGLWIFGFAARLAGDIVPATARCGPRAGFVSLPGR